MTRLIGMYDIMAGSPSCTDLSHEARYQKSIILHQFADRREVLAASQVAYSCSWAAGNPRSRQAATCLKEC
jgi:hypothetical protein